MRDAHHLFMAGSRAFTDAEANGIRIDVDYLDRTIAWAEKKVRAMDQELRADPVFDEWRKLFGEKADLGSRTQLGRVVFDVLDVACVHRTKTGKPKTDAASMEDVDNPFVHRWIKIEQLKKVLSTNLIGVRKEVVDGYLHPHFNLNMAVTYRSSSSNPNFQNFPNRDPKQAKLIRRAFIPTSDEYVLIEADFSGIEVRAAACYHHDPVMIKYIQDDYDLHKDMAGEMFKLEGHRVSKPIRQMGKSGFVFPSFYGDWYHQMCQNVWREVDRSGARTTDGVLLRDHLTSVGLIELGNLTPRDGVRPGSFEAHIKSVEDRFWNERFRVYTKWKKSHWESYLENGWYRMLTGFISRGVFKRNEVINGPIQGTAFHWLLWSLIELNAWLKKKRYRTRVVGQIHDSIVLDAHREELDEVLERVRYITMKSLPRHWKWINVPIEIEIEMAETNWYDKKEVKA